jgi:hypothetical protein
MSVMRRLLSHLRSDRGDASPVALIAASILTMVTMVIIGGAITTMLAGSSLAQSNSDLTTRLEQEIVNFEKTPYNKITDQPPTTFNVTVSGRTVPVTREVFFDPSVNGFTLRVTAPRGILANRPTMSCGTLDSAGKTPKGCLSLSSTVVGTPSDIGPNLPSGITVSVRDINNENLSTNLATAGDFEGAAAQTNWSTEAGGAVATVTGTSTPRSTGAQELIIQGDTVVYSQPIAAAVADRLKASGFARVVSGSALVQVGLQAGTNAPTFGPSTNRREWSTIASESTAAAAGQYRLAIRVTNCSGCRVAVDDVTLIKTVENILKTPATFETSTNAAYDQATGVVTFNGGNTGKWLRYNIASPQMTGINAITVGMRLQATAQVAGATGTVTVEYAPSTSGTATILQTIDLAGIGTESVPLALNHTIATPTAVGRFIIRVTQTGGPAKTITASDISLVATGRNSATTTASSVEIAKIDPALIKDTVLRVSYQYTGSTAPRNLKIGVFCSTNLGIGSLSTNNINLSQDTSGRDWYWARLEVPALDRLNECGSANIRVWSADGDIIESALVKDVTLMKVLAGVTSQRGGEE